MSATSIPKAPILAIAASLALPLGGAALSSGCGDDGSQQQIQQQKKAGGGKRRRGKNRRGGRGRDGAKNQLDTYAKIPDEHRRDLKGEDFRPDSTGNRNRDPFFSYVIRQPGNLESEEGIAIEPTDVCTADNTSATSYSLRELKLIGIVLRGTRAWAQFRDGAGDGHIVQRGDCLGKEKAVVEQIGAGYVRLEVTPEAPPGGAAPEPQKHDVPLYPEELELEDSPELEP